MKRARRLAQLLALGMVLAISQRATKVCEGFLPENNMRIPVTGIRSGGLSETQFNAVLDKLQAFYAPIVSARGGSLNIEHLWNDDTVNASASREGSTYSLHMYGGLARFPAINEDGYLLVGCHEMGHHLGGAPKIFSFFGNSWASNEGEADYFATLRCLRALFPAQENADFVANHEIDAALKSSCEATYTAIDEQNLCMREGMAGLNVTSTFQALKKEAAAPRFDTPDTGKVDRTNDDHPATQCRLDTYFQAALCVHDTSVALSDSDFKDRKSVV